MGMAFHGTGIICIFAENQDRNDRRPRKIYLQGDWAAGLAGRGPIGDDYGVGFLPGDGAGADDGAGDCGGGGFGSEF